MKCHLCKIFHTFTRMYYLQKNPYVDGEIVHVCARCESLMRDEMELEV